MRYFIRAAKYFVQLMVILAVIIAILVVAKVVDSDISKIFVNGYDSLWQIALMMACFAAIYPRFGYGRRQAIVPGSDEEVEPVLRRVMEAHGYVEEGDSSHSLRMTDARVRRFRKKSVADRVMRIWEDRITVERCATGFELEGISRDVVRLVNALRG
jgi:hypothetical protein